MVELHLLEVLVIVDILSLLRVLQSIALQGRGGWEGGGGRREGRRKVREEKGRKKGGKRREGWSNKLLEEAATDTLFPCLP